MLPISMEDRGTESKVVIICNSAETAFPVVHPSKLRLNSHFNLLRYRTREIAG
jgi:hypothetical protein